MIDLFHQRVAVSSCGAPQGPRRAFVVPVSPPLPVAMVIGECVLTLISISLHNGNVQPLGAAQRCKVG